MSAQDHRVIASLLLSCLSLVVVLGILLAYFVVRWRHLRREEGMDVSEMEPVVSKANHSHPLAKPPACWLAVKNRNLPLIQSALALHNSKPCSWMEGLSGDSGQQLFISPPIAGWVLVVGEALPEPDSDVDACFCFLMELSRKVGHVQYFQVNAVLNHHAWAQADSGQIIRAYAWADKTLWNQGEPTVAEKELRLKCYDYFEGPEAGFLNVANNLVTNSDKIHLLAARWSLDPENIDERFIEQEWGIAGETS